MAGAVAGHINVGPFVGIFSPCIYYCFCSDRLQNGMCAGDEAMLTNFVVCMQCVSIILDPGQMAHTLYTVCEVCSIQNHLTVLNAMQRK